MLQKALMTGPAKLRRGIGRLRDWPVWAALGRPPAHGAAEAGRIIDRFYNRHGNKGRDTAQVTEQAA